MTDIPGEIYKHLSSEDLKALSCVSKLDNVVVSKVLSRDMFYDVRLSLLYPDEIVFLEKYIKPDGSTLANNPKARSMICRVRDMMNLCSNEEDEDNRKDKKDIYVTILLSLAEGSNY